MDPNRSAFADKSMEEKRGLVARLLREQAKRPKTAPLSYGQERLWFLQEMESGSTAYNITGGLRFEGRLDVGALAKAIREVIDRHEALRTRIDVREGVVSQVIE